jgi:hypothetical protein
MSLIGQGARADRGEDAVPHAAATAAIQVRATPGSRARAAPGPDGRRVRVFAAAPQGGDLSRVGSHR